MTKTIDLREQKLKSIIEWAHKNSDVRVALLTSSLVNPLALVDQYSDIDIELVFENNDSYISNQQWLHNFGKPMIMVGEGETFFDNKHAIKMVIYEDGVKVDFKLYSKNKFVEIVNNPQIPYDWDIGYEILIDKDNLTQTMLLPTYHTSIIKKPSEEKFIQTLNDFWWDMTYVAKSLARDELFYAKFVSESIVRSEYLVSLLEWYIASQHNWDITTNKHGRMFKKYLSKEMWGKVEKTFSGSEISDNWNALFAMTGLVSEIAKDIAKDSDFTYPENLEADMLKYLEKLESDNLNSGLNEIK